MKLMALILVAFMVVGITATSVALAQTSSDVVTESDAGGGDLTARDILIIVGIVVGILLLLAIL